MQQVVNNELAPSVGPPAYWRYRKIVKNNGTTKVYEIDQTKGGTVRELLSINGHPLPPALRAQQETHLQAILSDPSIARNRQKANSHDSNQEDRLFSMLPTAFLLQYDGHVGNLVRIKFRPNPNFDPPTREAQVFHHMAGYILVDPHGLRLAAINGRLITEVKFFWGLLGYLNKGGTFSVFREPVGGGHWQLMRLKVNMHGVALFFKTIGVQENERYEDYKLNPAGLTLREAVQRLQRDANSSDFASNSGGHS
jgi:hypothetical protein